MGWAGWGAQPDYFPLHPGNQWVYRCGGSCAEPFATVEVVRGAEFEGRWYWMLNGFGGRETWLRQDTDGILWAFNPDSGEERRWYSFLAPEGESFDSAVDPCAPTASIVSRNADYSGPVGEFTWALQIGYASVCADAGLSSELFLPWVGLIRRAETTIAGPRTYDLIFSRTGGVTEVTERHISFTLALDRSYYIANLMPPFDPERGIPRMTARLTLRSTTGGPIELTFPTSQRFDLEIRNERGEAVRRWSDGRMFLTVLAEETVDIERNYVFEVPLADREGNPLPAGRYVAEGWLATEGPKAFSASVAFELAHAH